MMGVTELSTSDLGNASYFTTLEVAKFLGMAVRSIQLMVDRGDLQAWKTPGGHRRITRESLERWLQSHQGNTDTPLGSRNTVARSLSQRRAQRGAARPRVLLIEDSTYSQTMVEALMAQRFPGVEFHVASDGISGLVLFGHLQPDLLIVDILLPGIDGATLITGLRRHELFGTCKLVVLTSLEGADLQKHAYALKGVDVVSKGQMMTDLPPLIEQALGSAASVPDLIAAQVA
jgi:excisionase family DNA binding protein